MTRTTGWASPIELWCYKNSISYLFKTRISATEETDRQTDRDRWKHCRQSLCLWPKILQFFTI